MAAAGASPAIDIVAALLNGEDMPIEATALVRDDVLSTLVEEDLQGLVYERLIGRAHDDRWLDLREEIARLAHAEVARELVRRREIVSVLDGLAGGGVRPILLKGTALAYSVYQNPSSRPRADTDLLIRREQVEVVRQVMSGMGYGAAPLCDGELLFCQFEMEKRDAFHLDHAFDFHWKISTQPMFADVLTFDDLEAEAVPLPALGSHARGPGPIHALLHACIHPVMHHRNAGRLIWFYDVHLLVSRMSGAELDRFVDLALRRRVAAVSAHSLAVAGARFGACVSDVLMARLAGAGQAEPSAAYLQPGRRWHDELASSIRGLPRWRDRVRLLREILFPAPRYMLGAYRLTGSYAALLPALYVHRTVRGAWNVLVGRK